MNPTFSLMALLLLSSAPASSSAFAICVSTSYRPVAWTADGQAVIVEEAAGGPEGGGSLTFLVIDFRKKKSESFAFSSTFSPGDGSEPESISEEACRAAAVKGNTLLDRLKFEARFKTEPKACRKNRASILQLKDKIDYSIDFEKVGPMAIQVGLPGRGASAAAFSKNGRNSIIIENDGTCESRCYRVRPGKNAESYVNDGSCE